MALTPRSFFSPTLLVAAVLCAGMALVGATLFVSAFWCSNVPDEETVLVTVDDADPFMGAGCDHLLRENGSMQSAWAHDDWVNLAACFEGKMDNRRATTAAATGLGYFPASERLHNIRGYNLIVLEEYEQAVAHLRVALQSLEPTEGTIQNNLAWAGLFAPNRMALSEARLHYRAALELESSCETFHTGMWVEYGIASRSHGAARDEAIAEYDTLRARYEPCTGRVDGGDRLTAIEVAGAGILDAEIHKLTMIQFFEKNDLGDGFAGFKPLRSALVQRSLPGLAVSTGSDVAEVCEDIAPVHSAMPGCIKALSSAISVRR